MARPVSQQASEAKLRILTVDDHAVVRNGIKRLFENRPWAAAFGEASNAQEATKRMREQDVEWCGIS